jgi:hypothetical protein
MPGTLTSSAPLQPAPPWRPARRLAATAQFLLALLLAATLPAIGRAQYIYLDSNGDGVNTEADVLNEVGTPTTVSIWLDTSRNADSTEAFCPMAAEPLSLFSYEVVLHAEGGTVSYGTYTNLRSSMGTALGGASSDSDFYTGFGGTAKLAPGLYQLGTIPVTVESGSPSLSLATSTPLGAHYATTFGTECPGQEGANTYLLGLDWLNMAGCGPPGGGQAALTAVAPARVELRKGAPARLAAEFVDFNASDSLAVSVDGLPPGLTAVAGTQSDGRRQLRIYGVLGDSVPDGASYRITWVGSDGSTPQLARTEVRTLASEPVTAEFEERVSRLVTARYHHGIPVAEVRKLGTGALPILARMLRDDRYKRSWSEIASAIGSLGDTAYFDTLHAFIWTRYHGEIDRSTFMAMLCAQGSLNAMATTSGRVLSYLASTATPSVWASTPWRFPDEPLGSVTDQFVRTTLVALAFTDSEAADAIIEAVPVPPTGSGPGERYRAIFARGLHTVHAKVRARGYLAVQDEEGDVSRGPIR